MSSNRGAEKPTLKYLRSSPSFHNSSWYLVKMRPSTSEGDVSPCFTWQIQVKSIVSEFKDSHSNSPLREWSCPGMTSMGTQAMDRGRPDILLLYHGTNGTYQGRETRNKDHKRRIDKVLKCKRERFALCCIHVVNFAINHHR